MYQPYDMCSIDESLTIIVGDDGKGYAISSNGDITHFAEKQTLAEYFAKSFDPGLCTEQVAENKLREVTVPNKGSFVLLHGILEGDYPNPKVKNFVSACNEYYTREKTLPEVAGYDDARNKLNDEICCKYGLSDEMSVLPLARLESGLMQGLETYLKYKANIREMPIN